MRYTHQNKIFGHIMQKINPVGDVVIQEIQFCDGDINPYTTTTSYVGPAIEKLAEFEDLMQEYNIKNIEELNAIVKRGKDYETNKN